MDFTHKISLKEKQMNQRSRNTKAQNIFANTVLVAAGVGVIATGVVLRKKYNIKIEAAKEAGVNEWLREMADNNLTMLVVTQDLAERMFEAAQDIAINERFTTVPR